MLYARRPGLDSVRTTCPLSESEHDRMVHHHSRPGQKLVLSITALAAVKARMRRNIAGVIAVYHFKLPHLAESGRYLNNFEELIMSIPEAVITAIFAETSFVEDISDSNLFHTFQ